MERYTIKQSVRIVKQYYQNDESLVTTIRRVHPILRRNNFPDSSIVENIIEKIDSNGPVVDVEHTIRTGSDRLETNIAAAREIVARESRDL